MRVLEGLSPEKVFYYFEDICRIPHGSGNTGKISDYLVEFAAKRGLAHYQDSVGNVIIIKEASEGYENHPPVMLQGHMDMVAVKKPDCDIDMRTEGLRLKTEGDAVWAEGTSLGGDDGIAVAYGLALLDGQYRHPRIELVITVDEEVGMDGARAIDLSPCRAKTLVNLDSEDEGIFLAGCAGGARVNYSLEYEQSPLSGLPCSIEIAGLKGGHSGAEIQKGRGNANGLLGRILTELGTAVDFGIRTLAGGLADNAIPRQAEAHIMVTGYRDGGNGYRYGTEGFEAETCRRLVGEALAKMEKDLAFELAQKDPGVKIEHSFQDAGMESCMGEADARRIAAFVNTVPGGVQAMSGAMEGLVETSLNLGILECAEGKLKMGISVRSSLESAKYALIGRLKDLALLSGAEVQVTGDYPGWAYRSQSPLREKMAALYEEMFRRTPQIQAIHAGLECGLFAHKIPDLDCVSIGPAMKNIHTTEEELCISSTERMWRFLIKLLEEM